MALAVASLAIPSQLGGRRRSRQAARLLIQFFYFYRRDVPARPWVPLAEAAHRPWCRMLLPGLSLILHFGPFSLAAGAWRPLGADCAPVFRAPRRSTSLREFWSRRWNLAFSEMTVVTERGWSR